MKKNWIEGADEQDERVRGGKGFKVKMRWERSAGCTEKECILT